VRIVGVCLAGGRARRMGGDKTTVALRGRPLLLHPLEALMEVVPEVAVVAKRDTELPALPAGVRVWVEPPLPQHPLTGIVHALRLAGGRAVLVAAGDLALLDAATLRRLAATPLDGALAVVPRAGGRLQPLCAVYAPQALRALAAFDPQRRLTDLVQALGVHVLDEEDATPYFNVNAPDDLLQAAGMLDRRDREAGIRPPTRT